MYKPVLSSTTTSTDNLSKMSSSNNLNSKLSKDKMRYKLANPPTLLQQNTYKFLILGAPTNKNIKYLIEEFKSSQVTSIVRVCEPTYSEYELKESNINIFDLQFADGSPPSEKIINKWLNIVRDIEISKKVVAIHCVGGLGRSCVLVAVALIEFCNMTAMDAINKIRSVRRGAINEKQSMWLQSYQKKGKNECCIVL